MNFQNRSFSEPKASIADDRNQETRKIDELIQVTQRLLELLDEKRHALITHGVTRGVNPHVPMGDSGVEWIGEIPQHWQVIKLRRCILSIESGQSLKADEKKPEPQEWGVLKLNAVKRGEFDDSQAKTIPVSVKIPTALEIHPGDFLIARTNNHDVCYVQETRPKLVISNLMYRLRLDDSKLDGQFLSYFLQSHLGRLQIDADARGIDPSLGKIYSEQILDWLLLLPSIKEQQSIVDYIETILDKMNALKTINHDTIEVLQELRIIILEVRKKMTVKDSQ